MSTGKYLPAFRINIVLPYLRSGLLDPEDGAIMPLRNISNYVPVTWDDIPHDCFPTPL